jgi:uncharacterized membrane protein YagU involved in acid resistance
MHVMSGKQNPDRRFGMTNSMNGGLEALSFGHPRPLPAIVYGGVVVGAVDLAYAIMVYSPRRPILIPQIPQTIASGILGLKSYSAAAVYYLASRKLPVLVSRAVLCGLIYGALVYAFMHIVVLPLSAVPKGHTPFVYKAFEFVEHWFCVGLPIALFVRHYSR